MDQHWRSRSKERQKQEWANEKPKLDNARRLRGFFFDLEDGEDKVTIKTKHACIVEAYECTGRRLESSLPQDHEDHIAGKGYSSMTHYNLVHRFIPMPQAMKIPDARAAVDKEWKKLESIQFLEYATRVSSISTSSTKGSTFFHT